MTTTAKHQILIVGGGTAGITVAARMLRKGYTDVAIIEPSNTHYYQPLWTLVGGGQAKASTTERAESSVMPKRRTWIKNAASAFDPDNNTVTCADGATYEYDVLVVCPGHPARLEPHRGARGHPRPRRGVVELPVRPRAAHLGLHPQHCDRAPRCSRCRQGRSSAPARRRRSPTWPADYWRKQGVLNDIDVHLVVPTPRLFGIPAIADNLDAVVADYGITVHTNSEVTSVDAAGRKVRSPASAQEGPTPCCPTTCCTPYRASRRRTGSSPARCPPATQTATSTSTSTPCSTCGTRTCSASATPARHRTRRPAPRSASRPRSSSTTSTRS